MFSQNGIYIFPDGRMDTRNAARYLGYAETTLAMMRSKGTGPRFIKPGKIYYYKDDLNKWLEQKGLHKSAYEYKLISNDGGF